MKISNHTEALEKRFGAVGAVRLNCEAGFEAIDYSMYEPDSVALGAGRATKDSVIDYSAGIILEKKTGDAVSCGDVVARLYANDESFFAEAESILCSGVEYGKEYAVGAPLIHGIIL